MIVWCVVVFVLLASAVGVYMGLMGRWRRGSQKPPGEGISLLVPFKADSEWRQAVWDWLRCYYENELPAAELIMGHDHSSDDGEQAFCKTAAVNDAASRATGDIFVILDADCYINGQVIEQNARRIREARDEGERLWFIPYRRFYRLTRECTELILESDPRNPLRVPDDPESWMIEEISEKWSSHGHWFGALIQEMPREAFEMVGGMDPRFRDWGGEDVSFMRAVDTIYGRHHTSHNPVFHLWHPRHGTVSTERHWANGKPGNNDWLSDRYTQCIGDPARMRQLVDEGFH